jgi:uncharacterized repeat protein (TIGR03803 family)
MLKIRDRLRLCIVGCGLALVAAGGAQANNFHVVHSFAAGNDGSAPYGNLIIDGRGVVYGTTSTGGPANSGTVFRLIPGGKEKVLHAFSDADGDGATPYGGVLLDKHGNLYGTTSGGGQNGLGIVYKLTPRGRETILHTFQGICCGSDGSFPYSELVADRAGNMYGTTYKGGNSNDLGTVFKVTRDGTESLVHEFAGGSDDGSHPLGGLAIDKAGNLFGATSDGGASDYGVVYTIPASGGEVVLDSFFSCFRPDACQPQSSLIVDKDGNVYGTSPKGGLFNEGTVYKVAADGTDSLLHQFGAQGDGLTPYASLIMDGKGNLYGTTSAGGANNLGIVFKLTPKGKEIILHSFRGPDGSGPRGGLVFDAAGNLYGTAANGGRKSLGVVFEITPH